ncbi:hypothetical protein SerAS12_2378 [Serratia sp. AS12]|jgi:hypothetical protein|nr:hypothetical protein SerAS9_2378 [Serratia plymuthica AS9]AEF50455.1 hypothetical protein SerAS12_2378 [Serratia sp. AS12]AEG28162.1 hypothetical protein SerAS13_2379 [Serratia sp. AS13]
MLTEKDLLLIKTTTMTDTQVDKIDPVLGYRRFNRF